MKQIIKNPSYGQIVTSVAITIILTIILPVSCSKSTAKQDQVQTGPTCHKILMIDDGHCKLYRVRCSDRFEVVYWSRCEGYHNTSSVAAE